MARQALGLSPFDHEVEISNGRLLLYWRWNRREYLRAFTPKETRNLLHVLDAHRIEIEESTTDGNTKDA